MTIDDAFTFAHYLLPFDFTPIHSLWLFGDVVSHVAIEHTLKSVSSSDLTSSVTGMGPSRHLVLQLLVLRMRGQTYCHHLLQTMPARKCPISFHKHTEATC